MPLRLLVPIRVSRDTDESRSPENQRLGALEYQDAHPGVQIIFTDVPDLSVSGATPIEDRPGVAPWMRPERLCEWDGIGGFEMDRLSRDLYDYLGFIRKYMDRGKIVVDLTDGTDSTTLKGRQILEDRVLQAQRFREAIGQKRAQAASRIADAGEWDGGRPGFGYMPVTREKPTASGKTRKVLVLIKDPVKVPTVLELIEWAFAGESYSEMARRLAAKGFLTALGKEMSWKSVSYILHSPTLAGFQTKMEGPRGRQVVTIRRDREGNPIRFTTDPIINEDRWLDLQAALNSLARPRGGLKTSHQLRRVAFCRNCSVPCEDPLPCAEHDVLMRGFRRAKYTHKGNYYYCPQCNAMIELDLFDSYVAWRVLHEAGKDRLHAPRIIRGDDHSAEVVKLQRKIESLRLMQDADYDEDIAQAIVKAEARIDELTNGNQNPDRVLLLPVEPPTTVGAHWRSLKTSADRNQYLIETGCIFYADSEGVTGTLGWMALESGAQYRDFRLALRGLKLPVMEDWLTIARRIGYQPRPKSQLSIRLRETA